MANLGRYREDQIAELRETFQLFDVLGDNKISISVIGHALRSLGTNPRESDLKKFTDLQKPDERINFESFLSIYRAVSELNIMYNTDEFVDCLRHFDKEGNGFISSAELRYLLTTLGEKFTDDEVEDLLTGQKDFQGNVNYEQFVSFVMSGGLEVVFPGNTEAEVACNTLKVDKEPPRSNVSKTVSVDGNRLIVKFSAASAKSIRTAVNSFMEHLILVIETIKRFGPPVAQQYAYFTP